MLSNRDFLENVVYVVTGNDLSSEIVLCVFENLDDALDEVRWLEEREVFGRNFTITKSSLVSKVNYDG